MSHNPVEDPLFYGTISLERKDVPTLRSGKKILSELDHLMEKDQPLDTPLRGEMLCNLLTFYFRLVVENLNEETNHTNRIISQIRVTGTSFHPVPWMILNLLFDLFQHGPV